MDDSPDHINGSVPDCATCGLPCPSTNFKICLMCGKQVHSNCCQELGLPALIFGCGTCAVRFTSDARWNWRNTADPKLRSVLNNHGDQRSQTIGIKLHLKDAISRIFSRNVGNEENITPQVTVNVVNSQSVQGVGNATCHIPAALSCTSNSQNPDPVCEGTNHKRLSSSNMCSKYRSKKRKSTETYDPGIPIRGHYETDPDTSTCNGYTKVAPKAFKLEFSKEFHDRIMGPAIQDQINHMKNSVNNLKNEWGTGGQCDAGYAVFREMSDKILSRLLDTLNGRIRKVLGGDGNVTKDELMWTMMMYLLSCVMTSPQLDLDTSWDLVSYYLQSKQIRIPVSYNRARMKLIFQNLTVVDIDKSSTNHVSTGAECFREMEQLLTKAARNIVGNAVAVTGDDQQDYYKGAPGSNPKQSVYCRDVFVDAYFFILYATKLQSKNYDRLTAIETLIADLGITPDSKPETWFSFDQGYATPNQLDVLQKYHLNSLSIVNKAEFGNHAFWTNSANRKDEMRLRGKNYLNGSEQDFTPRVSSELTIDDDPRMGHTQFVALHESRTAIAVREPGIGLSSTNAKVLRFIGTGDTKKLIEDLFGVYVAVPKSFSAKVKNSLPFFPGISSQAKNKWCKLAEVFLTTKTNPLTVLKFTQDWFIRRRFRITADVGGAIVRTTKMRHYFVATGSEEPMEFKEALNRLCKSWFSTVQSKQAMQIDSENKANIVRALLKHTNIRHILELGMFESKLQKGLAESPDGLVAFDSTFVRELFHDTALPNLETTWTGLMIKMKIESGELLSGSLHSNGPVSNWMNIIPAKIGKQSSHCQHVKVWWNKVPLEYRTQVLQQATVLDIDFVLLIIADGTSPRYMVMVNVPEDCRKQYAICLKPYAKLCNDLVASSGVLPSDDGTFQQVSTEWGAVIESHMPLFKAIEEKSKDGLLPPVKSIRSSYQALYSRIKEGVNKRDHDSRHAQVFARTKLNFNNSFALNMIYGIVYDSFCISQVTENVNAIDRFTGLDTLRQKMKHNSFGAYARKLAETVLAEISTQAWNLDGIRTPTIPPERAQTLRTQPESAQALRTQVESAQTLRTQPESAQALRTQVESAQTPRTQPESAQAPRTQPESAQAPRTQPESAQALRTQVESAQTLRTQPESAQTPSIESESVTSNNFHNFVTQLKARKRRKLDLFLDATGTSFRLAPVHDGQTHLPQTFEKAAQCCFPHCQTRVKVRCLLCDVPLCTAKHFSVWHSIANIQATEFHTAKHQTQNDSFDDPAPSCDTVANPTYNSER